MHQSEAVWCEQKQQYTPLEGDQFLPAGERRTIRKVSRQHNAVECRVLRLALQTLTQVPGGLCKGGRGARISTTRIARSSLLRSSPYELAEAVVALVPLRARAQQLDELPMKVTIGLRQVQLRALLAPELGEIAQVLTVREAVVRQKVRHDLASGMIGTAADGRETLPTASKTGAAETD